MAGVMAGVMARLVKEAESGRKEQKAVPLLYRFACGKSFHIISSRHGKVE
jgi:hypothetical protein